MLGGGAKFDVADQIVALLTRAVGVVDRQGNLHAPAGTPVGGRFVARDLVPGDYSEAQQAALREYSSWEYSNINKALRDGRMSPRLTALVDTVRRAMAPTTRAATTYRRASGKDFGLGEYVRPEELRRQVGKTFAQAAFMSTTLDEDVLAGHPAIVHMVIDVPAGTKAADLHDVGLDHDYELLLDLGQRYRLKAVEPINDLESRALVEILPPAEERN